MSVRKRILLLVLCVLGLATGLAPGASGQDATVAPPAVRSSRPIAYKQEESGGVAALGLRVGGGLLAITVLAFAAAVLAKRYLPGLRGYSLDGKSRIQLLESRRITPRLTLFVLEFEGRRLLLAQSGDRLLELDAQRQRIRDE
jgi:hypothetical protein